MVLFREMKSRPNIHPPPSNQSMKPTAHCEISSACLPRHPAVAYLLLVRCCASMPFYRFHLDTALPEPAAFERVREFTRPRRTFRESIGIAFRRDDAASPPFLGTVGRSCFRLRRDIRYRNSFLPLIWGRIVPSPRGSRINVTMFLHPLVAVFMIIWFSGLGYALAQLWVHRKEAVPFAVLIPAAMFLFGVALVLVCFIPEAIKAKRLLESAIDASNHAREQAASRRTIQLDM